MKKSYRDNGIKRRSEEETPRRSQEETTRIRDAEI